jgi:VanZ family protein
MAHLAGHLTAWSPPLLWGLAILALSGDLGASRNTLGLLQWLLSVIPDLSPDQIASLHGALRKLGHMLAYGVLCFLWYRAYKSQWPKRHWFCLVLAVVSSLLVALLDEGHQSLAGTRSGSLTDVGWDLAGAVLSSLIILVFRKP